MAHISRRSQSASTIERVKSNSPVMRRSISIKQKLALANLSEMMKISEVSVLNNVSRMTCYRAITNKQFLELYPGDRKRMPGAGLKRSYFFYYV